MVQQKYDARCSKEVFGSLFHINVRLVVSQVSSPRWPWSSSARCSTEASGHCSTEVFGLLFYKSFGSLFHRSFAPDMYPGTEASVRSYTVVFGSFSNFTSNIDSEYGDPTISR